MIVDRLSRAFSFALLAVSQWARAQTPPSIPKVTVVECAQLPPEDLAEQLRVEVGVVGELPPDVGDYVLLVDCSGGQLVLSLRDRQGNERLRRALRAVESQDTGALRRVAIASAELLMAWNWVPSARPAPAPTQMPLGASPTPPEPKPEPRIAEPLPFELGVSGLAAAQSLGQGALHNYGTELLFGIRSGGGFRGHAEIGFLAGEATRKSGQVRTLAWSTLAGVAWSSPQLTTLAPYISLSAGAAHVRAEGVPDGDTYSGAALSGWVPVVRMSAGPILSLRPLQIAALGTFGWTVSQLEARVPDDVPVEIGGPFVGARLLFLWPGRPAPLGSGHGEDVSPVR